MSADEREKERGRKRRKIYGGGPNAATQGEKSRKVHLHLSSSFTFHLSLFPSILTNSSTLFRKIVPPSFSQLHSLCVLLIFHPPPPPLHPRRDLVSSLRLSHTYGGAMAASLCHIYSLCLTLCSPRQPTACFYFYVYSQRQHRIIPLNPRANMPPHLNRLRRMRAVTALQTQFLQSVLLPPLSLRT